MLNYPYLHDPEPDELLRFKKHHVDEDDNDRS